MTDTDDDRFPDFFPDFDDPAADQGLIGTSPKKTAHGMAPKSLDLIEAMAAIAEKAQPITGRGVGYKLFTRKLITSMAKLPMKRVYRLLKEARERGIIDWDWIVDETRAIERTPSWSNPRDFAETASRQYRRDFWKLQPNRCQVWSEKGTVRGVLAPVLHELGVGFMAVHGFGSATCVHDIAEDDDGRELIILYVGDYDPSGMCMSEWDLPKRLERYAGGHVTIRRIALTKEQTVGLPSFAAADKKGDKRYKWFVENYGDECWELDALDPNVLRACVEKEIRSLIEPEAWKRCETVSNAECDSLREVLTSWSRCRSTRGGKRAPR